MKLSVFLSVGILAAVLSRTKALTKEELTELEADMVGHMKKCGEEFGITKDDLKEAKEKKNLEALDPCFLACVFKSTNLMSEDGLFVPEALTERSEKFIKSDEDKATVKEIVADCTKVNDEKVSDDKKGCDRAKLLYTCYLKHKNDWSI